MNKEEKIKTIVMMMEEQKFHDEKIKQKTSEINNICLEILKEEKGLEIGSEFHRESKFFNPDKDFKITKIEPYLYIGVGSEIIYALKGVPKKKDGTFSKREMFIRNISVYILKGLNDE